MVEGVKRSLQAVAVTVGATLLAGGAGLAVLLGVTGDLAVIGAAVILVLVWLGVIVLVRLKAPLYLGPAVVALPLAFMVSVAAYLAISSGLTAGWFRPVPTPTTIGVIESSENVGRSTWRYTLHTGDQVTVNYDTFENLGGGGDVGTLLLVGEAGGQDWYMGLRAARMRPAGRLTEFDCFVGPSQATENSDSIDFFNGLRLPKASEFDPRSNFVDGRSIGSLCVNEAGEILF